ncbi:hypothetical protein N7462_006372, partial [Penicillium macrosclerotiorum]|uniref:uncharacterized protein n=1 Tax=Penicillium macrosclerotiorum TaxID=303699 RepID=UPI002549316F
SLAGIITVMPPKTRAVFEPLPPHLDVDDIVKGTPSFEFAKSITCNSIDEHPREDLEEFVLLYVVRLGIPLQRHEVHHARDLGRGSNLEMSFGHYLNNMRLLAEQFTSTRYNDRGNDRDPANRLQRLYLKDIDCPNEWRQSLEQLIPPAFFYLNQSPKPFGGPGSKNCQVSQYMSTPQGEPIARAGDLMSSLPVEMQAQNLMCYIGHEGTYTPAHQEMCASLGHNLMVEASDGSFSKGKATRPGSSIWFMTETKDRHLVSEYWMSTLGHDIDLEDHFAQLSAWRGAPFTTYVVEQKPGDLILIPPLAAHQVWNRGTRTMKVAWNRTTIDTLEMALDEALAHARLVCRDEQYKNKAIIFFTLEKYSNLLQHVGDINHPEVRLLQNDFERLFVLYTDILLSESFSKTQPAEKNTEFVKFDGNITCSYCRCNIFNRFLTCPSCIGPEDDTYDICMDCYVFGRSCACISNLNWVEQFRWKDLTSRHETWRQQILAYKRDKNDLKVRVPSLIVARGQLGRKTIAEICQEQLLVRPWVDCSKPKPQELKKAIPNEQDPDSEDSTQARKRRRTSRGKSNSEKSGRCHMCRNAEYPWKMASCDKCKLQYCYGSLFRAFDISPQDAMDRPHWLCPKCQKKCNCTLCRKDPTMNPHEPYNILLGHDTRKIADPRSVESLVNLRVSNRSLLRQFGDDTARRLERLQHDAEQQRDQHLRDNDIHVGFSVSSPMDPSPDYSGLSTNGSPEGIIPVDPALGLDSSFLYLDQGAQEQSDEGGNTCTTSEMGKGVD